MGYAVIAVASTIDNYLYNSDISIEVNAVRDLEAEWGLRHYRQANREELDMNLLKLARILAG
jgi:hypothetical protein